MGQSTVFPETQFLHLILDSQRVNSSDASFRGENANEVFQ